MMDFSTRIKMTLRERSGDRALEYEGRWHSWADVRRVGASLMDALAQAGVADDAVVGIVVRNRAVHAAAILAFLASRRSISLIYAFQSPEALAAEIRQCGFAAVIADRQDWPGMIAAAQEMGTAGIQLDGMDRAPQLLADIAHSTVDLKGRQAEPCVEVLSSGTTGAPKRIPMPFHMLERAVASSPTAPVGQEIPAQINIWPLAGVGGICLLAASGATGTPLSIIEKFSAEEFAASLRRNRPVVLGLSPTAIRMILDAGVAREDMASVKGVYGGSAKLDPNIQDRFEQTYDVPIYWAMGATEFCGTIVRWTPDLRQAFGSSKRGSVGQAMDGIDLRIVDPETGAALMPGSEGLLEVLCPDVNPDWVRTTDLASIDADGFVFHHGRYDGAIVRGGFKILPERIADAIRAHDAVADAAVVGIDDDRLGMVPVAAVELHLGALPIDEGALMAHVRHLLPAPSVPTRILIVPALPRTPSLKVSLPEIRSMFLGTSPELTC